MTLAFFALAAAQLDDIYLLPIGPKERVRVEMGVTDLRCGCPATADDIARAADGLRYVLVGESHNSADHHKFRADVIAALVKRGRRVSVGFEMFTRPNQLNLNPYSLGEWNEDEFIKGANWQQEWGFPFSLYKPIFDVVRENRLPMVALNIPRDWVRSVGRSGMASLTSDQIRELTDLELGNKNHRMIFDTLMGGHPPTGAMGQNIYTAQVLWDEGMADTAIKATRGWSNPGRVLVIVAGAGHVMYGQGIGYRITRRTGLPTLTVTCIDSEGPRKVSRGLGDFVFVAPPPPEAGR